METPERLIVDLARLDDGTHEHVVAQLDAQLLEWDDVEHLRPVGVLSVDLQCQLMDDELLVRGVLSLPCRCVCSRCGADFDAVFEEREYCDSFNIEGLTFLDLTDAVREGILLTLPFYPICKEDCKGVCLHCGKNLNVEPCGCPQDDESSPWDALDDLTPEA